MKTNQKPEERQYARVARIFPKTNVNAAYAKIRVLATNEVQQ